MNTDWGAFALYIVFIVGLGIAAHVLAVVEQKRSDKKFERWNRNE